ncbi:hypothetical protein GCM10017044_22310 [Kordiimonas sediminis]|uniref:Patatin-like phospholipase family protein n=2 Tax=Kordiimonas sediminis TaxID=1735581 RepID=A0A919AUJ2_9PROT|nr:hypothetical protein GCM10017044_22310 [Kordiimonas sediminis]
MSALRIIAGKNAKQRIEDRGLTPDLVRAVVGASGGPKWLVLQALDRFLFGAWLPMASQKIDLVGSSIGAWRMALAAHPEPSRKVDEFIDGYLSYRSSNGVTAAEITRQSYEILDTVFPDDDKAALTNNPQRNLNIVAVRCKGLTASRIKLFEFIGLLSSAVFNAVDRKGLGLFFDRVVFHSHEQPMLSEQWQDYNRVDIKLGGALLPQALMASGSVPFVIDPVVNIPGAPEGVYRDGGVIDYHFDVSWKTGDGIILYPHFYPHLIPGWFDKRRVSRRVRGDVWDDMLLLCPTDDFVASLPYQQIPERSNFTEMPDAERLTYWKTVISESRRLEEELGNLLQSHDKLMDCIEAAP